MTWATATVERPAAESSALRSPPSARPRSAHHARRDRIGAHAQRLAGLRRLTVDLRSTSRAGPTPSACPSTGSRSQARRSPSAMTTTDTGRPIPPRTTRPRRRRRLGRPHRLQGLVQDLQPERKGLPAAHADPDRPSRRRPRPPTPTATPDPTPQPSATPTTDRPTPTTTPAPSGTVEAETGTPRSPRRRPTPSPATSSGPGAGSALVLVLLAGASPGAPAGLEPPHAPPLASGDPPPTRGPRSRGEPAEGSAGTGASSCPPRDRVPGSPRWPVAGAGEGQAPGAAQPVATPSIAPGRQTLHGR